jgi:WD40 repeat protein
MSLSFLPTDSNLLASGHASGEFKLWNGKEEACICSFNPGGVRIRSLFFAGGADSACIAVTNAGSVIRLWRAEGSLDFASEIIGDPAGLAGFILPVLSLCGSFLATATITSSSAENASTLALYDLETMTKTQSVVIPDFNAHCLAMSPDSKQLAVGDRWGRIRHLQAADFSIQKVVNAMRGSFRNPVLSLAIDPTCRVLAFGYRDGTVALCTLQMSSLDTLFRCDSSKHRMLTLFIITNSETPLPRQL